MASPLRIAGQRFGRLLVVKKAPPDHRSVSKWECQCDCGTSIIVLGPCLTRGSTQSCGCIKKELHTKRLTKHGELSAGRLTTEYSTWRNMLFRCESQKCDKFKYYGGRGIMVCERWHTFEHFLADMGRKPSPKHSIDRYPDNDGNYEPRNCRWATAKEQMRDWKPRARNGRGQLTSDFL